MTVENDEELIDRIASDMVKKIKKRNGRIFDPNFVEGDFKQVPITDALGRSFNIGIVIYKSENPLPGNPIVLFAPGDNENIDVYKDENENFTEFGVSFCAMDYRGNSYSEGEYITHGINEIYDVFAVIKYLYQSGYQKVCYFGRSRAATCGLHAAHEFPNLTCVALDSPRFNSKKNDEKISDNFDVPIEKVRQILPRIYKKIIEMTGIDFSRDLQPREFVQSIKQPIYVIHGERDRCIPFSDSKELMPLLGSEEKKFESFNGGHNDFQRVNFWAKQFYFIVKHCGSDISEKKYIKRYFGD